MTKVQYTPQQILNGIDVLARKIAKIGLSAQIISPVYLQKEINGKTFIINRETMPLATILTDVIWFITGQLSRCFFDPPMKNNTASISVLIDQIFHNENDQNRKLTYKKEYDEINEIFNMARPYENNLRQFSNEYFAHTDIKPLQANESSLVKIGISFNVLISLIKNAKDIISNMYLVYEKTPFDFSESAYEEYTNQFWKIIDFPETKISKP